MLQAIFKAVRLQRCARQTAFLAALAMVTFPTSALAQASDPPELDAAAATEVDDPAAAFGSAFAGSWGVSLASRGLDDSFRSGGAEVTEAGGVILTLSGPEGEERFHALEIEMQMIEYANDGVQSQLAMDAGRKKQFTIHLKRERLGSDGEDASLTGPVEFINLPARPPEIEFKLLGDAAADGDVELRLPINWLEFRPEAMRMRVGTDGPFYRREGLWDYNDTDNFDAGGTAMWRRDSPTIDDVIVVGNQLMLPYPFRIDGTDIKRAVKTRRLIIHGINLQQFANATPPASLIDNIGYKFDPGGVASNDPALMVTRAVTQGTLASAQSADEPNRALVSALERRLASLADVENLYFVDATLLPDVTPGPHQLLLENTGGKWPLAFANQGGVLQFGRHGDQVRTEATADFYSGDIAAVDLIFEIDMPFKAIGILLMQRKANGVDDGAAERGKKGHVLIAKRLDDMQAPDQIVYRSDPIHLLDASAPKYAPPDDPDALKLEINDGDVLGAKLLEPGQAFVTPNIAVANVAGVTDDLGELWKSALRRVAQCDGDTFDGDSLYALKRSAQFSETTVGELVKYVSPIAFIAAELSDAEKSSLNFNPTVDVYKGDHAAAILIRDELVDLMADSKIVGPIAALADNANQEIQALRARAVQNGAASEPLIQHGGAIWSRKPFWREPTIGKALKSLFGQGGSATSKENGALVPLPLSETLDIEYLAERFDIPYAEAEAWAIKATQRAAKRQLTNLEKAIGRAQDAGDCNLEELLVVAGQESDAAVANIVPQLVKKISVPGPPPRDYWEADKLARGYVERLHMAGAAVRALDQYGAIDDAYKAITLAVLTAGAAAAATAVLSGGAAVGAGILIAGDVADLAYFGAKGLDRAIASQEFYDYAHGASLILGDDILLEAEAQQQSVEMALLGLIAPGVGAGIGVKELRHFKNIDKGKALLKAKGAGVLNELDSLTPAERTQVAAYYADLLDRTRHSGFAKLAKEDRAAFDALSDFEKKHATVPPPSSSSSAVDGDGGATSPPPPSSTDEFGTVPPPSGSSSTFDPNSPNPGFPELLGEDFQNEFSSATASWNPGDSPYDKVRNMLPAEDGKYVIAPTNKYDVPGAKTVEFGETPLGRGGFNTVFPIDDALVARVPGGLHGKPSANALAADKGGRTVFQNSDVDQNVVRLVELKDTVKVDDALRMRVRGGRSDIRLDPGDEIEIVENFTQGTLKDRMATRNVKKMTAAEAIAYDKGVRELNQRGLVALDLKYDNFGFEPVSAGSSELRLVILDPGGIVPIKTGAPVSARHVQANIDSGRLTGIPEWNRQEIINDFGDAFDVSAINLKNASEIPFNPMGVSDYERGRALSSMTAVEAEAYYQTLLAAGQ